MKHQFRPLHCSGCMSQSGRIFTTVFAEPTTKRQDFKKCSRNFIKFPAPAWLHDFINCGFIVSHVDIRNIKFWPIFDIAPEKASFGVKRHVSIREKHSAVR